MDHLLSTEYLRIHKRLDGVVQLLFGFQGMHPLSKFGQGAFVCTKRRNWMKALLTFLTKSSSDEATMERIIKMEEEAYGRGFKTNPDY